jgi:3-phosphoshikimate 1-carboxyvinyltransferase
VILEDTEVCRKKETDRIKVMEEELSKLGGKLVDGLTLPENHQFYGDQLIIYGNKNALHGGTVESYDDHRVAMSLACFGLGLENDFVTVKNGECCSVSFPGFFEKMNDLGAGFQSL